MLLMFCGKTGVLYVYYAQTPVQTLYMCMSIVFLYTTVDDLYCNKSYKNMIGFRWFLRVCVSLCFGRK